MRAQPARSSVPVRWIAFLAAAALGSLPAAAAAPAAALQGRVLDERGEPMPGVIVTITCGAGPTATVPLRVITDASGAYAFKGLDASLQCSVRADVPGYATVVVGPIALKAGRVQRQEIRLLAPSETTELVVVEARGAVVDTESAAGRTVINEEYIEALPLVGRSFQDLLTLAPGVTDVDGDGNPNVHGARDTGLQYRLDGADVTDPVTGHYGHRLNLDAIQEVEVITSGAPAEYSRADGGFAVVTTKSGGNSVEGSLRLFFRSRFLDGDGAANQDLFVGSAVRSVDFRDLKGSFTLGGPIVRNRLWYFASVEKVDIQTPVSVGGGAPAWVVADQGFDGMAKLTWQASADNKVALQHTFDPRRILGLGMGVGVAGESDYERRDGARTTTLRWTSILGPALLMETIVTHYDKGVDLTPVAGNFRPVEVGRTFAYVGAYLDPVAYYPCNRINCSRALGRINVYQHDLVDNVTSGPFYYDNGDRRVRNSLRSEFTLSLDDALGPHTLKAGAEFGDEFYRENAVVNPVLYSELRPSRSPSRDLGGTSGQVVEGSQTLYVYEPGRVRTSASGGGMGAFVQDLWKPRPNLAVQAGVRLDLEIAEALGMRPFQVRGEARTVLRRFDMACDLAGSSCRSARLPGRPSGPLPPGIAIPPGHPLEEFDLDEDGYFEPGRGGEDLAIYAPFTIPEERESEFLQIRNRNLAPRLSVSWDPWNDGKTRISGTWGRYYDRLFIGTVTAEQYPDEVHYTFYPKADPERWISPGDKSASTSKPSSFAVARDLATPYQDERTIAVEREVAPEWSVKVAAVHRGWWDLLQDVDVNHITCPDFRKVFGIDPHAVCPLQGRLWLDMFGGVWGGRPGQGPGAQRSTATTSPPNGAVDLYTMNQRFNQIYKIGNYNGSSYKALEVVANRRLHRGWQMQASYTLSRARGDAETFLSSLGDDPGYVEDEAGYLDYDQRHVVKLFAATHLARRVILGGIVEWSSGTPYSVVRELQDADDLFNVNTRTIYVTQQRNDQRNGGSWDLKARVEKGFTLGLASAEAYLSVENLLDDDDLILSAYRITTAGGASEQRRRFGRRMELGFSLHF
jgi:hypothetical protein